MNQIVKILVAAAFFGLHSYDSQAEIENNPLGVRANANTSYLVGSVGGDFQVSPSGSLQYNINLDLPDGCGGFKPELSIFYDSSQGDGILGYGFSISSLSSIRRVPEDYSHDGKIRDITLSATDKLALDGNRMLLGDDGYYYLEINSYWRVKADNTVSPNSFVVQKEDGSSWYYGRDINSRVTISNTTVIWMLDKVVDSNGNYYKIDYANNYVGQYWIRNIKYGGNEKAGLNPPYTIQFNYSPRNKGAIYYMAETQFFTDQQLTNIEIKHDSNVIRKYVLTYKSIADKLQPFLTSIKITDGAGNGCPPTKFDWSEIENYSVTRTFSIPFPNVGIKDMTTYVLDVDGDGKRDFILVYPGLKQKLWKVLINKGNGRLVNGDSGLLDKNFVELLTGDFNGDGKYEFIEVISPSKDVYEFYPYISNGNRIIKYPQYVFKETKKVKPFIADFNGDCVDDILLCYNDASNYKLRYTVRGLTENNISFNVVEGTNDNKWSDIYVADFSGDGMADIINLRKDGYDYLKAVCNTTFINLPTYSYLKNNGTKILGDFNGDGKRDILSIDGSTGHIYTSTGTQFSAASMPSNIDVSKYYFFAADINGDGNEDLYAVPLSGSEAPLKIFINTNYGLEFKEYSGINVPPISNIKEVSPLSVGTTAGIILNTICYDKAGNITKIGAVDTCMYDNGSNRLKAISASFSSEKQRPIEWDEIVYNSDRKVTKFVSGDRTLNIRYGVDGGRIFAEEIGPESTRSIKYINRLYQEESVDGLLSKNCYIFAGDQIIGVCQDNAYSTPRYYHYDRLGSLLAVTTQAGDIEQQYEYDPWGTRSCKLNNSDELSSERKGFTGHEHIELLNLVNMNGRIYDPYVGRFITPDPFMQDPFNTQSLNRYAYCANNPLKYTDPSGHFFLFDDFLVGFFKGLIGGKNPFRAGGKHFVNSAKIWGGLFMPDKNKNFWGKIGEIFSRFTFQRLQTNIGFLYALGSNMFGNVIDVKNKFGATVITTHSMSSTRAITLGCWITGGKALKGVEDNFLFQHEYGHYIQSQRLGRAYLPVVGLPSLFNAMAHDDHKNQPYEMNANFLSFKYFNKNVEGFYKSNAEYSHWKIEGGEYLGWYFWKYPLSSEQEYVNYYDTNLIKKIQDDVSLKTHFWNFLIPFIPNSYNKE